MQCAASCSVCASVCAQRGGRGRALCEVLYSVEAAMHCRQMQRRIARMVALLTPTAPPVCLRIRPRAQEAHVAWAGRGRLGSGHKFEPPCSSRSISECTKLHGTASEASSGQYSNCGTVTLAVLNAPMDCSRRERRPPLAVALRRKGCACMGQPTSVRRCAYEQHCNPLSIYGDIPSWLLALTGGCDVQGHGRLW